MTKKSVNETIEKFLRSDRVEKATGGDEIEKMKLRNMIEVALRKHLAKLAHKIFFKYGHKADFDMSGSPLVEIFDGYGWEDPR